MLCPDAHITFKIRKSQLTFCENYGNVQLYQSSSKFLFCEVRFEVETFSVPTDVLQTRHRRYVAGCMAIHN